MIKKIEAVLKIAKKNIFQKPKKSLNQRVFCNFKDHFNLFDYQHTLKILHAYYLPLLNKNPPFNKNPPLRTKKYCTNYYIFSGVFGWWNLMKCLSPNALISLILPHYELFIEFESHGDNPLKMGKSNSSEKKKMKLPMFCPSLQRKSEGQRKLASLPWSESIAT